LFDSGVDTIIVEIFDDHPSYYANYEDEIKLWMIEKRWEEKPPLWMTESIWAKIPVRLMPAHESQREGRNTLEAIRATLDHHQFVAAASAAAAAVEELESVGVNQSSS